MELHNTEPMHTILLVDDIADNLNILNAILTPFYRTKVATTGEKALQIMAAGQKPDLILLDVMMPGLSGYDVCKVLKQDPDTSAIPVIFVTAMSETADEQYGLELGAVDYITKPVNPAIVLARVKSQLALYDQNRALEQKVQQRTYELLKTRQQIIHRLGRAAEYRDNETGNHIMRMSLYCRAIGQAAGLSEHKVAMLFHAAPMHDVGKIGIPDHILQKPGQLTADEWAIMCRHPAIGADIIGVHQDELLQAAYTIALYHHEKWDGSGYPAGLAGEAIPLFARIAAIADVFDALTMARVYKKAWSADAAHDFIAAQAGQHFDPALVTHFLQIFPQILQIKHKYDEELGLVESDEL